MSSHPGAGKPSPRNLVAGLTHEFCAPLGNRRGLQAVCGEFSRQRAPGAHPVWSAGKPGQGLRRRQGV